MVAVPQARVTPGAADLLGDFRTGRALFSSPAATLLTAGELVPVTPPASGGLATRVALALDAWAGNGRAVAIGAVPFDLADPPHLFIPRSVRWASGRAAGPVPPPGDGLHLRSVTPLPSRDDYLAAVRRVLSAIDAGLVSKTVLARRLDAVADGPVDVAALVRLLAAHVPTGHLFAVPLAGPAHEPPRYLTGVSPELLVSRSGLQVTANPLAGSVARSADPTEDQRRRQALLASAKDLREHAYVRDAVREVLSGFCTDLSVSAVPTVVGTPTLWHLSSRFVGRLRDGSVGSLELALALHPTPAVCGVPRAAARRLIAENEAFDRGCYAGLVGWCDSAGDGEWAVTLRCAEVEGERLFLYAGAGIVGGSDPAGEFDETSAKLTTFLQAIGADAGVLDPAGDRTPELVP